ncbi:uncharacterized protein LOC144355198 [Saccoglossus kowalevskii]
MFALYHASKTVPSTSAADPSTASVQTMQLQKTTEFMEKRLLNLKGMILAIIMSYLLYSLLDNAALNKECKPLLKWSSHIVNHFWYCCQKATSYDMFFGMWGDALHHVVDEHSWVLPYIEGSAECDHATIALIKQCGSKFHYVVLRLYETSTAELETCQQHILMYAAKRYAYSPPVYRARTILAALDHNIHADRKLQSTQTGEQRYLIGATTKTLRYSVKPIRVQKTYLHIAQLMKSFVVKRLTDTHGMQRNKELEPQDPRRISLHPAPLSPPRTDTLVEQKNSRRT